MLIGTDGVYSYTFEHEKKPECPVCGGDVMEVEVGKDWTVERLMEWLTEKQNM
jgi:ubiquitin-activating enzyme E1 C